MTATTSPIRGDHPATRPPARRWPFPWVIAEGQVVMALLAALGYGLAVACVVVGIARRGTITGSIWEPAANAVPWYTGFIAGYLVFQMVPMLVANGFTRRDAARSVSAVVALLSAVAALVTTLGYLIEYVAFRWQGWPLAIGGDHLFTRHTQVGEILWESLLTMALWSAIGSFIGAALYRWEHAGWLAFVPAGLILSAVGIFITARPPFFNDAIERALPDWGRSLPMATVATLVALAGCGGILWWIVRDMPLRRWR